MPMGVSAPCENGLPVLSFSFEYYGAYITRTGRMQY